jgi:hypothetical protein
MIKSVIWTRLLVLSTLVLAALSLPTVLKTEETKKNEQNDFNPELDDFVPADRYLTHDEMITWLQSIARRHPKIAKTFSIGKSEQGRELLVLELSHSIERGERDLLMPMVKLVGVFAFLYLITYFIFHKQVKNYLLYLLRLVTSTEMKLLVANCCFAPSLT